MHAPTTERRVCRASDAAELEIWAGLQRGEESARLDLWWRFGPALQRFALARLGDEPLAEEVMLRGLAAATASAARFDARRSSLST